jgi:hypothetical protein
MSDCFQQNMTATRISQAEIRALGARANGND